MRRRLRRYGYGSLPNVITSYELEKMLREGRVLTEDGRLPRYVTIVNCVGSRSKETHPYCSRVCCMTALKYGHEIRSAVPGVKITNLYTDMNAFGKGCEDFYLRSSERDTIFMMYDKWNRGKVRPAGKKDGCELLMVVKELLSGEEVEIPSDLVVLMVGMEPRSDSAKVARLVNISRDKDGWFIESHPKLDPVATTTDGVFIAGACQSPEGYPRNRRPGAGYRRPGSWQRSATGRSKWRRCSPRSTRASVPAAACATNCAPTRRSSTTRKISAAT